MRAEAVIFTGPSTVTFGEVTCPEPGPDDVVVQVRHSWISTGTELSVLRGERMAGDTPHRTGDPSPFPRVPGYQKVGQVEAVGANVSDLALGDWVFGTVSPVEGMFRKMSGHVSPAVLNRGEVWPLPIGHDPVAFSGAVLTQVGFNCGSRPAVEAGDGAVVLGDGLVGLWTAQTLAWRGARVLLVGRHPERLALFEDGTDRRVLDVSETDLLQGVNEVFPDGFAVAVDAVGRIRDFQRLATRLRRGGHLVSAGFYGVDDLLALQPLRESEAHLHLVSGWQPDRLARTIELIASGHLATLPLITHRFPARLAAEAWQLIQTRREPFLGVVLDWAT